MGPILCNMKVLSFLCLLWDLNIISILHDKRLKYRKPYKIFIIYIRLPSLVSQRIRQIRKY